MKKKIIIAKDNLDLDREIIDFLRSESLKRKRLLPSRKIWPQLDLYSGELLCYMGGKYKVVPEAERNKFPTRYLLRFERT